MPRRFAPEGLRSAAGCATYVLGTVPPFPTTGLPVRTLTTDVARRRARHPKAFCQVRTGAARVNFQHLTANSPASSGGASSVNVEPRLPENSPASSDRDGVSSDGDGDKPRLSHKARKIVASLRARKAADRRVLMKRKASMEEGQWGSTKQIELENTKLDRVQLGSNVYVTTDSFYEYSLRMSVITTTRTDGRSGARSNVIRQRGRCSSSKSASESRKSPFLSKTKLRRAPRSQSCSTICARSS